MLDADTAIYAVRGNVAVDRRLVEHQGMLAMSAIVHSQLLQGATASVRAKRDIDGIMRLAPVLAYDERASEAYGRIIAMLGFSRTRMLDRMIAAHAVSRACVLVTNNVRDFVRIEGLRIENWAEPAL